MNTDFWELKSLSRKPTRCGFGTCCPNDNALGNTCKSSPLKAASLNCYRLSIIRALLGSRRFGSGSNKTQGGSRVERTKQSHAVTRSS